MGESLNLLDLLRCSTVPESAREDTIVQESNELRVLLSFQVKILSVSP